MSTKKARAALALRTLADWISTHDAPNGVVSPCFETSGDYIIQYFIYCTTRSELLATAKRIGGRWRKRVDFGYLFNLDRDLGYGARIRLSAGREVVCERVVVGTRKTMAPDPRAPLVEVEEEIVEWRCPDSLMREVGAIADA